jgi:hypothetical protein
MTKTKLRIAKKTKNVKSKDIDIDQSSGRSIELFEEYHRAEERTVRKNRQKPSDGARDPTVDSNVEEELDNPNRKVPVDESNDRKHR